MHITHILSIINDIASENGATAYICGGVARDKYMKNLDRLNDVDITCGSKSNLVFKKTYDHLNTKFNIKHSVASDTHGMIFFKNVKFDFSSNYLIPDVKEKLDSILIPSTDLNKEMFSRDFTCNSLLLSMDLKSIYDPTKRGMKDIEDKVIRTIFHPAITLPASANPNNTGARSLRALYLACKLDFDIDPQIINWITKNKDILTHTNQKQFASKIDLALEFNADKLIYYINKMNLWDFVPITDAMVPYFNRYNVRKQNV